MKRPWSGRSWPRKRRARLFRVLLAWQVVTLLAVGAAQWAPLGARLDLYAAGTLLLAWFGTPLWAALGTALFAWSAALWGLDAWSTEAVMLGVVALLGYRAGRLIDPEVWAVQPLLAFAVLLPSELLTRLIGWFYFGHGAGMPFIGILVTSLAVPLLWLLLRPILHEKSTFK